MAADATRPPSRERVSEVVGPAAAIQIEPGQTFGVDRGLRLERGGTDRPGDAPIEAPHALVIAHAWFARHLNG